jgi:hypothetical protein
MSANLSYKKKLFSLSILFALLLLTYIFSFVFDPARRQEKTFSWFDLRHSYLADRIEIAGISGGAILVRINSVWYLRAALNSNITESNNTGSVIVADLPVRQQRVDDFFQVLSEKVRYTLYSKNANLQQAARLSLMPSSASRITIFSGSAPPLLDLLFGTAAAFGTDIYITRGGRQQSIYLGEDRFTFYTDSSPRLWLDTRLLPRTYSLAALQDVQLDFFANTNAAPLLFRRNTSGWIIPDTQIALNNASVEAWSKAILEIEAEDFAPEIDRETFAADAIVTLRFGDGAVFTIHIGNENEDGSRNALVSSLLQGGRLYNEPYTYVLSERTIERILTLPF